MSIDKSIPVLTVSILFIALMSNVVSAQTTIKTFATVGTTDSLKEKRLEWFRDARFGMFIHWGVYSVPAGEWEGKPVAGLGEWIMNRAKIPVVEYEKLPPQFNPSKFDAEEIVRLAKNAGMKYIVITSKHHDGFAMYHSRVSKYNIYDATPFKRDPLKELAEAAQKAGIKLGFYYSQTQDWHEPDAVGNDWDFPDDTRKNFQKYLDEKVKPQVTELLTNYGPIGLVWFDTPRNISKEQSQQVVDLVHKLQPDCLVSGRVGHGLGDYDSAGDNQISMGNAKRIWETPVTMNDTWGFKKDDQNWKPVAVLIRQLVQVISQGGNYLLNVGPTYEGLIPSPSVERLREVGDWLKKNNDSVYGAGPSPFPYQFLWGIITTKAGKLYLHVFNSPQKQLVLYGLKNKLRSAYLLEGGTKLKFSQKQNAALEHSEVTIQLPRTLPDKSDSVIALELSGDQIRADTGLLQQPDSSITLPAFLSSVHRVGDAGVRFDSRGVAERWTNKDEWVDWDFKVTKPGTFDVVVVTSQQKYGRDWEGGHSVALEVAGQNLESTIEDNGREEDTTNPYWPYIVSKAGRITVDKPGKFNLSLKPISIIANKKLGLTLVSVKLIPVEK
jgi:alpha-L-fucosidase